MTDPLKLAREALELARDHLTGQTPIAVHDAIDRALAALLPDLFQGSAGAKEEAIISIQHPCGCWAEAGESTCPEHDRPDPFAAQPHQPPSAAVEALRGAVILAAETFRDYARLHTLKQTDEGRQKAERNTALAEAMEAALAQLDSDRQKDAPRDPTKLWARELTDDELISEWNSVNAAWDKFDAADDEDVARGGSPREWMDERLGEIETAAKARGLSLPKQKDPSDAQ